MTSFGRHDNVIQLIGCACGTDGERELDCCQASNGEMYVPQNTL